MYQAKFTVEWGDCDEAGIVFYPKYFYWFDCSFNAWLRSRGLSQRELKSRFGAVTPLVDVGAKFFSPITYDDAIDIDVSIVERQEKRLRLGYRVRKAERLVAEGHEERAWATWIDGRLRGTPTPDAFIQILQASEPA